MVNHFTTLKNILNYNFLVNSESVTVSDEETVGTINAINATAKVFIHDEEPQEFNSYLKSSRFTYYLDIEASTKAAVEAIMERINDSAHKYNISFNTDTFTEGVEASLNEQDGQLVNQASPPFTPLAILPSYAWVNRLWHLAMIRFPTINQVLSLSTINSVNLYINAYNYITKSEEVYVQGLKQTTIPALSTYAGVLLTLTTEVSHKVASDLVIGTYYPFDVTAVFNEIAAQTNWDKLTAGFIIYMQTYVTDAVMKLYMYSANLSPYLSFNVQLTRDSTYPVQLKIIPSQPTQKFAQQYHTQLKIEAEFYDN